MSVALEGLRTVIYPSPDLDGAKRWWSELLGQEPYFDEPFYVGFEVGGYELGPLPGADPKDGALTFWGVADVGGGIVTATVRTPSGAILGLIRNPHFKVS
ncbi:MAG: VOC family protein [Acidimicrobiales bacterium]